MGRRVRSPPVVLVLRALEVALVLFVLAVVIGQAAGTPVPVGYVETGSMVPTLHPGDGFLAVPTGLSSIDPGDVIVYDALVVNGGRLTTHRVVGVTDAGYVTRGDANTFTDQDGGREPPVAEARVVAEVVQVGGHVVALPYFGTVATAASDAVAGVQVSVARIPLVGRTASDFLPYLFLGIGLLAYAWSHLDGDERTARRLRAGASRSRVSATTVVVLGAVLVGTVTTAAMVIPGGVTGYDVVSADVDAPGPRVIVHGTVETTSHAVAAGGLFDQVVYLERSGGALELDRRELYVPAGESREVAVTLLAPVENGYYRQYVVEHHYLALLPTPVIRALYGIHPWLALLSVDAVVVGAYLAAAFPLTRGRTVAPPRDRGRPASRRAILAGVRRWWSS